MKNVLLLVFFSVWGISAQHIVKGVIVDEQTQEPIQEVIITVKNFKLSTKTDIKGQFVLELPFNKYILILKKENYEEQSLLVTLKDATINLGVISLYKIEQETPDYSVIELADDELFDEDNSDYISGLFTASKDVFLRTTAFEWSSSFYRLRGLDSEHTKILINGIEMNKLYDGRPQWSNWGGLNDMFRNQETTNGLLPSNYTFGGALGAINFTTRASKYRKSKSISYAFSNRSYKHRFMGSYATGELKNGWSFAFSVSRRLANEGFIEGTPYNAYSLFGAIEKQLSSNHSIGLTSIYAFNQRGKNSPITQEVFDIKGAKYNAYWGYQDDRIRNSRTKHIQEPILILSHYWDLSEYTTLNTNLAYQFGEIGNSRLDYMGAMLSGNHILGRGSNPDPTYYKKLPSSIYKYGGDNAFDLYKDFKENGQIHWNEMYAENLLTPEYSKYILYEDRTDDEQFTINSILNSQLTDHIRLNARLNCTTLKSKNYAKVLDLLGGQSYLDVDTFADTFTEKQNNLLKPNHKVRVGDEFKYNYLLNSTILDAFMQAQCNYRQVDFYIATDVSSIVSQREGFFKNGGFPNNSLGKSDKSQFINFKLKSGVTYKITGRHILQLNGAYINNAPTLRNLYLNVRENNILSDVNSEKLWTMDLSYVIRTPIIQTKISGYYVDIKDACETSFFFGDGVNGDNSEFVIENTTGISKQHIGAELGFEIQLLKGFKIKGASNFGQYIYNDNAYLTLISDNPEFSQDKRKVYLKNYKVPSGAQKAYALGFEYSDPKYWWFGMSANYLDDTYVGLSKLRRTSEFNYNEGIPFTDYNKEDAKRLLEQEKLKPYFTLNLVGGKSWKLKNGHFIGLFISLNNVLNETYKTGGFEQGRMANYKVLKQDKSYETPLFGNKYWYGRGANYFINLSYRL